PSPATHTLSLHDALPISGKGIPPETSQERIGPPRQRAPRQQPSPPCRGDSSTKEVLRKRDKRLNRRNAVRDSSETSPTTSCLPPDRKSTRLNSSHQIISY